MDVEARLQQLGLALPPEAKAPPGVRFPFRFVRVRSDHAYIAGHPAVTADGSIAGPFGKVGADLTLEQGYEYARQIALAMLGNLKRELGNLDRIAAWLRVLGMVNSAPGFDQQPSVINGFSDLILEVFGPEVGQHSRAAVGMAELPFNIPVEIEAEVELAN